MNGKQYAFGSNGSGVPNTQNTAALAQVGLTLGFGAIGQAPWSYLISAHAEHAIGYSGLAIVYAENYPLELGGLDPEPQLRGGAANRSSRSAAATRAPTSTLAGGRGLLHQHAAPAFPAGRPGVLDTVSLTSAANSYQKYTLAAGLLVSPLIDQQRSATDFLNELLLATNSTCVWSEGLLKFIPYGDAALTGNGADLHAEPDAGLFAG